MVAALQLPSVAVWELRTESSLVSPENSEVKGEINLFYLRKTTKAPPFRRAGSVQSLGPTKGHKDGTGLFCQHPH